MKKGENITASILQMENRLISLIIILIILFMTKKLMTYFPKNAKGLTLFTISFIGIIALTHIIINIIKH